MVDCALAAALTSIAAAAAALRLVLPHRLASMINGGQTTEEGGREGVLSIVGPPHPLMLQQMPISN